MIKRVYQRVYWLSGLFFLVSALNAQIFEQEAETVSYDSLLLLSDSTASEGRFLRMEKSGWLKWKVILAEAGWYTLEFRYRAFGGDKEEYLVKNGERIPLGFGMSDTWTTFRFDIYLEGNENILELKPSWGYLDIDLVKLDSARLNYSVTPKNNIYYLISPRDLYLKLDNFGSSVKSVILGDKDLKFSELSYPFEEKSIHLVLQGNQLKNFSEDKYSLDIILENDIHLSQNLVIREEPISSDLKIIVPYVEHGSSVLIILPDNSTMLVDCAYDYIRDKTIIPLLSQIGIDTLDYFFITHYHGDHDSGDRGEKIKQMFNVRKFYDYKSFMSGDSFIQGGANFKVLNSYPDGDDENTRSLSFKMEYKGFVFIHGGDTYGINQVKILNRFPEDVKADVFYANHHFHGSVDINYLRTMQPDAVVIQAQEAIYARDTYTEKYLNKTRNYLQKTKNHFIENLLTLELGTILFRINSKSNWNYENYMFNEDIPVSLTQQAPGNDENELMMRE